MGGERTFVLGMDGEYRNLLLDSRFVNHGGNSCDRIVVWLLAHYYSQPSSTLGLSNLDLGLYLDG